MPRAGWIWVEGEQTRGFDQLIEIMHTNDVVLAEESIIHCIVSGEAAGVRRNGGTARPRHPGLKDNDRQLAAGRLHGRFGKAVEIRYCLNVYSDYPYGRIGH